MTLTSYEKFRNAAVYLLIRLGQIFVLLLLIFLLASLFYTVHSLIASILPFEFACIISIYLAYKFIYYICRKLTFPGSTWLWRRLMENSFQRQYAVNLLKRVRELRTITESIIQGRNMTYSFRSGGIPHIVLTLNSTIRLYEKQLQTNIITKRQRKMMSLLIDLEQSIKENKIFSLDENDNLLPFWGFLAGDFQQVVQKITKRIDFIINFEDSNRGSILLEKCKLLENILFEIVCQKAWYKSLVRWLFEDSFGTLDQIREELDELYVCKPISVSVGRNSIIDCVLVSGRSYKKPKGSHYDLEMNSNPEFFEQKLEGLNNVINPDKPTMIICQPNAGYYEIMHHDNVWLDLYLQTGLNVLLWNYRGFGRSTGFPTPDIIKKDGEAIVDYLRNELHIKKIGVHGESLGGLVANHLARHKNLDYLCADRTFSSLIKVPELSFGKLPGVLYKLVTMWTDRSTQDYVETTCYKTVTFDPQDEVIHVLASLKHGITSKVIEEMIMGMKPPKNSVIIEEDRCLFSPLRIFAFLRKLKQMLVDEKDAFFVNRKLKRYYDPLTEEETQSLYWAFHRLSEIIQNDSCGDIFAGHKEPKLSYKSDFKGLTNIAKPLRSPRNPTDSGNNNISSSSPKKNSASVEVEVTEIELNPIDASTVGQGKGKISEGKNAGNSTKNSDLRKIITKKSYVPYIPRNYGQIRKIEKLISDLNPIFERLEAGGIELMEVMEMDKNDKYEAFRHFIQSFTVWGSCLPCEPIILQEFKTNSFYQKNATSILKEFLTQLYVLIANKSKYYLSNEPNEIISWMISDLELIASIMSSLHESIASKATLRAKFNGFSAQETGKHKETASTLKEKLLDGNNSSEEQSESFRYSRTGYLIPLSCGHNGAPNGFELEIFQYHVRKSNLLN